MKDKKDLLTPAHISLNISDDSSFLSPYSKSATPVISSEVADFLENSAMAYHPEKELILDVTSDCISEQEEKTFSEAIKNYYTLKLTESVRNIRRKTIAAICFSAIGILGLAFMFILEAFGTRQLWIECVDIFAWVFLWEAVDQFFIERPALKLKIKRYLRFSEMECSFNKTI